MRNRSFARLPLVRKEPPPRITYQGDRGASDREGVERRRWRRMLVNAPGTIQAPGASAQSARIFDLTGEGCSVEAIGRFQIGQRAWIQIDSIGPWEGRVCWTKDGVLGLEFIKPLYPAVLEMILQKNQASR